MRGAPGRRARGRAVEVVVAVAPSSGAAAAVRLPDPRRSYAVLIGSSRYGSAGLSDLPGVHDVSIDHARAHFSVDTPELNRVLAHLVEFDVRSLTSSPPTLEELFMRHYGDVIAIPEVDAELVAAR